MKMKKILVFSDRKKLFYDIRRFIAGALCLFIGIVLISRPEEAKDSAARALKLCGDIVIPSLFPFLFLSAFISYSSTAKKVRQRKYALLTNRFLPDYEDACVFFLSAVGGFPVGAKTAVSFYEKGMISGETLKRLIFSCVNPSPSFAVTAIGLSLFSSARLGLIIYASVVISNIILYLVSGFIFGKGEITIRNEKSERVRFSEAFVSAGKSASDSMIGICCYVIIFCCLCDIMKIFIPDGNVLAALYGVCEVTTGCQRLAALGNIPVIAGVIGWGGISVHFQIMDAVERSGMDIKLLFVSRAACAFLSAALCDILLKMFPTVAEAVAIKNDVLFLQSEKNIAVSIMMLLTCFVFLIGDCKIRIKSSARAR